MKCTRNILAIIAILTQIIMGHGLGVHAPDCHASQVTSSYDANKAHAEAHQHCGCSHHSATHSTSQHCHESEPLTPSHDCDCSQPQDPSYILSPQLVLNRIKLLPINNEADSATSSSQPSHSHLFHITNPSNAPPPDRPHSLLHVLQCSPHFTSIHLGVFLI